MYFVVQRDTVNEITEVLFWYCGCEQASGLSTKQRSSHIVTTLTFDELCYLRTVR